MLFEVYRDKQRLMYTEQESCIPALDVIKKLKSSGYKVLLNGKIYKVTKNSKEENS